VSEDTYYSSTRSMLQKLGLEKYEKNFKKGLLTDHTLPLLTDRYVYVCSIMLYTLLAMHVRCIHDTLLNVALVL
jgi:hypothetical protein